MSDIKEVAKLKCLPLLRALLLMGEYIVWHFILTHLGIVFYVTAVLI